MRNKKIYVLLGTVILLTLFVEILFAEPHYHMIWNELPGADIIGFAGAWILILIAKKIMAFLFQRREDYYDDKTKDGGEKSA